LATSYLIPSNTWQNAFTLAGLFSGSPIEIENIGNEFVRYVINVADPSSSIRAQQKILAPLEKVVLPFGLNYVWLSSEHPVISGHVFISKPSTQNNIFQNYQEANTKTGNSFKFSARRTTGVASGTGIALANNFYFGVHTGDLPVTIKSRALSFSGSTHMVYSAYEDSVYTGGTSVTPMNQGRLAVRDPLFSVVTDPTITSLGTQYLPDFSVISSGGTLPQSRLGTEALGDESNLKPNTYHLFRANNIGTGTADIVFLQILCYEGPLDYPI